ncbi:Glucose-methanol-choline oxidoreductase [Penicillium expansum]|nr:Glucose-methanol-choline oxidoreductase [Penicillium expansum]
MAFVSNGSEYDFIIVGGGTAGNAIAGRLAENPAVRILAFTLRGSKYDWSYKTTMIKRDDYERVEKPNTRGKALGGSSCANYFTWIPGSKPTFDDWEAFGGRDWNWDSCVEYLRKCATYHDDEKLYPSELSKIGTGGPVQISHADLVPEMKPFRDALTEAWVSKGQPLTEDIYSGEMKGLTHCVDTIHHGERQGSFLYLKNKPNVTILYGVHSKKLLIDPATRICSGVTVISDTLDQEISVYASREVILSQGVFETPKLLMLSGVGPAAELAKHGITPIVESPHVGQHLLDHPIVPFVLEVKEGYSLDNHILRPGPLNDKALSTYQKDKTGPASSGFLELWHYPMPEKGSHMTVIVDLLRPLSEGEVTLNNSNAQVQPNINLNFFGNDLDILAMREGVRWTYDLLTKGAGFKDIVLSEYPWKMPLDSDDDMNRAVLDRSQTGFHPCGTARLSKSIHQGVVDSKLRVHGVRNLRIADASVIPVIPDCRIQNSVYMIGEKGADIIKSEHKDLYEAKNIPYLVSSKL